METQNSTTSPEPVPKQGGKEKHNTGSRFALAVAFAWVGWHLAPIGLIIDAGSLLKGEPHKWHTIKDKKERRELVTKMRTQGGNSEPDFKSTMKAFKYTLIFTAVGIVGGAVIGWVRGNRAGSIRDIIHHPIKATKAVFGPKAKEPENAVTATAKTDTPSTESSDTRTDWRQRAGEQQEQAVAANR